MPYERVSVSRTAIGAGGRDVAHEEIAQGADARDDLRRRLEQVRRRVGSAGLDPSAVDEAIEAARRVS